MNDVEQSVFLVGRVLVGAFYLIMGLNHFANFGSMTTMIGDMGLPSPGLAVAVTGLLLIIAGVLILIGYHPLVGVLAAALFLVPVTLVVHAFWTFDDPAARQQQVNLFLRNIGILGATLMFVGLRRPWRLSLDEILARQRFSAEEEDIDVVDATEEEYIQEEPPREEPPTIH